MQFLSPMAADHADTVRTPIPSDHPGLDSCLVCRNEIYEDYVQNGKSCRPEMQSLRDLNILNAIHRSCGFRLLV